MSGKVKGAVEGDAYVLRQGERVLQTFTLEEARADAKLAAAIKRNGWGKVE